MSFGKMNTFIEIIDTIPIKDDEGFTTKDDHVITRVRAYKDERHGSRKWSNMAAYTKADATFQMRWIPDVKIEPGMLIRCDNSEYRIISVEIIKRFYIEVAAEKIEATKE